MLVQFIVNNPHLAPFFCAFFAGAILLVLAPVKYRTRTGKLIVLPNDLAEYNRIERKYLKWGIALVFCGIIGATIISDKYGYNYTFIDINGEVSIVNSKND